MTCAYRRDGLPFIILDHAARLLEHALRGPVQQEGWWCRATSYWSNICEPRFLSDWPPPSTPGRLSRMGNRDADLSAGRGRSPLSPQPHPAAPSEYLSRRAGLSFRERLYSAIGE